MAGAPPAVRPSSRIAHLNTRFPNMSRFALLSFLLLTGALGARGAEPPALAPDDISALVGEWVIEVRKSRGGRRDGARRFRKGLPPCRRVRRRAVPPLPPPCTRLTHASPPGPRSQKDSMKWFSHGLYDLDLQRQYNKTGRCDAAKVRAWPCTWAAGCCTLRHVRHPPPVPAPAGLCVCQQAHGRRDCGADRRGSTGQGGPGWAHGRDADAALGCRNQQLAVVVPTRRVARVHALPARC